MSAAAQAGLPAHSRASPAPLGGLRRAAWLGATVLSVGVALVSYRYLAGLGIVPPNIAANRLVRPWIAIHAGGAATALLVGPLQLLPGLRGRRPALHRWLGRAYVAGCAAGGVSAMVLAAGTASGPVAAAGFVALDLYWIASTALGTAAAIGRRRDAHRRWMLRSIALTFGAVLLRLYLPASTLLLRVDFRVAYAAASWLAWVPNAILMELYLRRTPRPPARSSTPARGSPPRCASTIGHARTKPGSSGEPPTFDPAGPGSPG